MNNQSSNSSKQLTIDNESSSISSASKAQIVRNEIIKILADCDFHSGEQLASKFDLSRSAISNHIKSLMKLGIDIYSVKGRGYKLSQPLELLDENKIRTFLPVDSNKQPNFIDVRNVVTSTNDVVKQLLNEETSLKSGFCCLSEAQTAGRGRRGRKWISPFGSSLYFTMVWHFNSGYQAMAGLSVMVGVTVNKTLAEMGIPGCKLKWPNDVYYDFKKVAGILIEVEGQVSATVSSIIGIGLNIQLPNNIEGIDQAYTDLNAIAGNNISRNELAAKLMSNLWLALEMFEQQGLGPFLNDWKKADLFYNKPIQLVSSNHKTEGICRGIDETGALLLEINHKVQAFHGGEISVRPA